VVQRRPSEIKTYHWPNNDNNSSCSQEAATGTSQLAESNPHFHTIFIQDPLQY